jgi:hypothetical protein
MSDQLPIVPSVPFYRRLWFVVLLTVLLFTFPVAMVLLLTGNVYRRKEGVLIPIGNGTRYVYGGLLALWLAALVSRAAIFPEAVKHDMDQAVAPSPTTTSASSQSTTANAPTTPAPANDHSVQAPEQSGPTSQDSSPDMNISLSPPDHGGEKVTITADDDKPFVIQRVVFNDRNNEPDCDFRPIQDSNQEQTLALSMSTKLPTPALERGQYASFVSICGETLRVTVYTNRGVAHYKMDASQH